MRKLTVAVLMGGKSHEHDVSLHSGRGVLENLPDKYIGSPVIIDTDGLWAIDKEPPLPAWLALDVLKERFDVVFIALHGPNGEDGTVQAMLQLSEIPYTASDLYASSLAMNKPRTKDIYRANGLATPASAEIRRGDSVLKRRQIVEKLVQEVSLPIVTKTTRLGSSVGIEIARSLEELLESIERCLEFGEQVMLEQFVEGTEVTAPVLEDPYSGTTLALPIIEIRPQVSGWFDFESKYKVGGADEICPAPISSELFENCRQIGLSAHEVLGCRGMSRTDIIIDSQKTCWVIETNTIPGFTQTSLLPQAAAEAGIDYNTVVDYLLEEALLRPNLTHSPLENVPRTPNG